MTTTDTAPFTFAAFVRQRTLKLLDSQPSGTAPCAPADDAAQIFFDQLNQYLTREGQPPIEAASFQTIPADFIATLASALEISSLRGETSPFTHGDDVKPRVQSRERNQYLADLMRAIATYYSHATHEAACAGEQIKLWKRVATQQADGSVTTTLHEVDRIDPAEHAIIALNGIWGMHHYTERTNGLMNQAEQLMGGNETYFTPVKGKPVAVYAVTYPDRNRIHYAAQVPAYNADPEHYVSPLTRDFVHRVMLPSIGLEDTGKPQSLVHIKTALRHLNFLTYSYGSTICREIRNVLAESLTTRGLRPDEIKSALAEVYALNVNPVCRLDEHHPCGTFSNIYQVSKNDVSASARADYEQHVPKGAKSPHLIAISDHELMVWENTPVYIEKPERKLPDPTPANDIMIYSADAAAMLPHSAGLANGHRLMLSTQHYSYADIDGQDPKKTTTKTHDPSHLQFSLRNTVGAPELPTDLSQTFEPIRLTPPPDPALASPLPPKLSETMKQAIRNFRDELKAKIRS